MAQQLSVQQSDLCNLELQCRCGSSVDFCCLPAAKEIKVGTAGLQHARQLSGLPLACRGPICM